MAELRADLSLSVDQALRQVERLRQEASRALTIDVDVPPVDLGLGDDLASVQSLDDGLADVTEGIDDATSASDKLGGALRGALAVVGAREIVRGLVALADAASDLEESSSKASVVFADSFGQVADFAEDAAVNIGLSEAAAFEAAGTFGNLFVAQGLAAEASAEMSTEIIQLGADLASFNNLEVDETLDKIRSGLVGEIEPLRQLGVSFNAAQVEAKAFELGLADVSGEIDDGAKIQARYQLILEQTATAQGDFARTSGGLANQQRILSAELQNAAAQLGQALLPSALDFVELLREDMIPNMVELAEAALPLLVEGFRALSPVLGATTDLLVAAAPALSLLASAIEAIPDPLLGAAGALLVMNRGLKLVDSSLGSGAGAVAAKIALIGVAAGAVAESFAPLLDPTSDTSIEAVGVQVETLADQLEAGLDVDTTSMEDLVTVLAGVNETIGGGLPSRIGGLATGFANLFGQRTAINLTRDGLVEIDRALTDLVTSGRPEAARLAFDRLAQAAAVDGVALDQFAASLPGFSDAIGDVEGPVGQLGETFFAGIEPAGRFADATADVESALGRTAAAADEARQKLRELADEQLAQTDALFGFAQARQDLADAIVAFDLDPSAANTQAVTEATARFIGALSEVQQIAPEIATSIGDVFDSFGRPDLFGPVRDQLDDIFQDADAARRDFAAEQLRTEILLGVTADDSTELALLQAMARDPNFTVDATIGLQIEADQRALDAALDDVADDIGDLRTSIDAIRLRIITGDDDIDIEPAVEALDTIQERLDAINLDLLLDPDVDIADATEALGTLQDAIDEIAATLGLSANLDGAAVEAELALLEQQAQTLRGLLAYDIAVDPAAARAELDAINRRIAELTGPTYNVDIAVDIETGAAENELFKLVEKFGVLGVQVSGGFIPAAHGLIAEPRQGGHLVRVAEAGVREVIIPLDDAGRAQALADASGLTGLLGGTRGVSNNISVSVTGAADPDAVATKTADELALVMLRAGG